MITMVTAVVLRFSLHHHHHTRVHDDDTLFDRSSPLERQSILCISVPPCPAAGLPVQLGHCDRVRRVWA